MATYICTAYSVNDLDLVLKYFSVTVHFRERHVLL